MQEQIDAIRSEALARLEIGSRMTDKHEIHATGSMDGLAFRFGVGCTAGATVYLAWLYLLGRLFAWLIAWLFA